MDILSLTGLVFALVAILGGSIAKGAGLGSLWNAAAFLIVIVGTAGAVALQSGLPTMRRAMRMTAWIVKPPMDRRAALVAQVVDWATIARKQGLLGLESRVAAESDPFIAKGLQLLVDGTEPDTLRGVLEIDLHGEEHSEIAAARVFEAAGTYAPTLGIVGAVLGLMSVMKNLADPTKLGSGIAAAFTATIYGIASANCFFLPAANKLKTLVQRRSAERQLLLEGFVAIAQGENPRNIEARLGGFLH
jgi:chemotaxis protein MotA